MFSMIQKLEQAFDKDSVKDWRKKRYVFLPKSQKGCYFWRLHYWFYY